MSARTHPGVSIVLMHRRTSHALVFTVGALGFGGLASAQVTHRASLDSANAEGDAASRESVLSPSGRLVVFSSDATNLVASDSNGVSDVFVRDPEHGTTRRVSVDDLGNQANEDSDAPAISADGRWVAFQSLATNLVAGDTNGSSDVFVRDLLNNTTERISVDSSGVGANRGSFHAAISSDGNFVAFDSVATNLDAADVGNTHADVYLRDRAAGTTVLLSKDAGGTVGDGASTRPSVSADAGLVAFESVATNLAKGDKNGCSDVYVLDRASGVQVRVSVDSTGAEGNGDSRGAALNGGGGIVAFSSDATNLVAGDNNGVTDAFVRVASTEETLRVSVDSAGQEAKLGGTCRSLSTSGLFCGFDSDSDLVAPDNNGVGDAFVHELFVRGSWTNYGNGFPGTNGTPTLSLRKLPRFGAYITMDVSNSAGAATSGWLLCGFQPMDLPTHFGGHLLVSFLWIQPIVLGPTGSAFPANIPDDFAYAGVNVFVQGVEVDAGATRGLSFTDGLVLTIGQ